MSPLEIRDNLTFDDLSRDDLLKVIQSSAISIRGCLIREGQAKSDADLHLAYRLEDGRWFELQCPEGQYEKIRDMFNVPH